MAKGRQSRKRTSTSTLVMSMLLMLTIVLLLLLALGILSLPVGSDDASPAHDLSSFGRKVLERYYTIPNSLFFVVFSRNSTLIFVVLLKN